VGVLGRTGNDRDMAELDPYPFSQNFSAAVVHHLIFTQEFWSRIGAYLEPSAFSGEIVQLVAKAAVSIATDGGRVAGTSTVLLQRIATWRDLGQLTREQALEASDYLEDVEYIDPVPDADSVIGESIPVLKTRRNREAMRLGLSLVSSEADLSVVRDHLDETLRLGETKIVAGTRLGPAAFEAMRRLHDADRLSTGISELDAELNGGPLVKTLSFAMGGAGDGKSMFLTHQTGSALIQGHNVAVATLELGEDLWIARLIANLTGVPIDAVMAGSMREECERRMGDIPRGECVVAEFTAGVTKVQDIIGWVDREEQLLGKPIDVLVVDYADLLGHDKSRDYEGMREVYGGLRGRFAEDRRGWVWTASQSRRKESGKKGIKPGANDGADSQNKIRVCDLCVVLNASDDGAEMEFIIAKCRHGKRGGTITLPTEFECARVAPMMTEPPGGIDDMFDL
jgi:hypothetical protein